MSVQTRSPRGGWSSISNFPNYSGVISNYAAALAQAEENRLQVELRDRVFQYNEGLLTFEDLMTYLNTRLAGETSGTAKELEMRQLISDMQIIEDEKQRDIKRAKLSAKFAKGGISAEENLQIEEQMLQFYKEGTPEHEEQLNVISTAKEIKRQSDINRRVASLTAELSEGGLSNAEQAEIYREMAGLAEPGSEEQQRMLGEAATYEENARVDEENARLQERREQALAVQSQMFDEFTADGSSLSNEEALEITRAMMQFVDRDTEDYINLKEQESQLVDRIENERIAGGNRLRTEQDKIVAEVGRRLQADLKQIESDFASGFYTNVNDYLSDIDDVVKGGYRDIQDIATDEQLSQFEELVGGVITRRNRIQQNVNAEGSVVGEGLVPVAKDGKLAFAEADQLEALGRTSDAEYLDREGNVVRTKAVDVLDSNGNLRRFALKGDGKAVEITKSTNPRTRQEEFRESGQEFALQQINAQIGFAAQGAADLAQEQEKLGKVVSGPSGSPAATDLDRIPNTAFGAKIRRRMLAEGRTSFTSLERQLLFSSIPKNKRAKLERQYDEGRTVGTRGSGFGGTDDKGLQSAEGIAFSQATGRPVLRNETEKAQFALTKFLTDNKISSSPESGISGFIRDVGKLGDIAATFGEDLFKATPGIVKEAGKDTVNLFANLGQTGGDAIQKGALSFLRASPLFAGLREAEKLGRKAGDTFDRTVNRVYGGIKSLFRR